MLDRLEALESRYEEINRLMGQPEVIADLERLHALAREQAGLQESVTRYRDYRAVVGSLEETRALLNDNLDEDMEILVKEEVARLEGRRQALEEALREAMLPRDPREAKDVIMEIRAGAGGEEAGLFAADLFRMYTRYAEAKRWQVEVVSRSESGIGGFKEIIFEVKGKGAFSRFQYESGVHRVQRVPATEASGRIHTSTATVAVLPEADEVEVAIDPDDLKIDFFHSGGPGGQNVNKVATAVRITYIPTGMVVICQDERSQWKNRTRALAVLRARLLDQERRRQMEEVTEARRSQVGTGERSEKIRTYNFPQNRITDHRVGVTVHDLPRILDGDLDELIEAVATQQRAKQLEAQGWTLAGNVFHRGTERYVPLYEAKMVHHFNHRFGDFAMLQPGQAGHILPDVADAQLASPTYVPLPRYWVPKNEVEDRLRGRSERGWLIGWRNITNDANARTLIASVIPRVGVGHSMPLIFARFERQQVAACLTANLGTFVLDYAARQKVGGTNLTYGYLMQLPVLAPSAYDKAVPWGSDDSFSDWISPRVLELVYTSWDLQPFARDLGYDGPPFRWDPERRFRLRCELDAAFFHLYGVGRDDMEYIMDTFPIVWQNDQKAFGRYRTKEVIRNAYDALVPGRVNPPQASTAQPVPATARDRDA